MTARNEQEQFNERGRYLMIPRTLVFLTQGDAVLLLRGAPTKRLWAGRYNGLGGHLEASETFVAGALREVAEEAGIIPSQIRDFALRALLNIEGAPRGVLLAVFVGEALTRAVRPSREGTPEWIARAALGTIDLVDGDRLLPRLLDARGVLHGHLRYDAAGAVEAFTLE